MEEARYLKIAEAAERLSVTDRFIEKKIAAGQLQAYRVANSRVVRVRADDVEALVQPK